MTKPPPDKGTGQPGAAKCLPALPFAFCSLSFFKQESKSKNGYKKKSEIHTDITHNHIFPPCKYILYKHLLICKRSTLSIISGEWALYTIIKSPTEQQKKKPNKNWYPIHSIQPFLHVDMVGLQQLQLPLSYHVERGQQ